MGKPIVLFGASGKTGQAIIDEAIKLGISIRQANRQALADSRSLDRIIMGASAVIIVFGPRPPFTDIFCARETEKIIQSMKRSGVKRLVCQTGAMIGEYPKNRSFLFELMSKMYRKQNLSGYMDRVKQEDIIKHISPDWTIVKPPRLVVSESKKEVVSGADIRVGICSSITLASLAEYILKEIVHAECIRKAVFVKN